MQEVLIHELPNVIEQVDEAVKQIYDPNTIWLESIQFADYVSQLGKHLKEHHGEECIEEISYALIQMSESWKMMGEGALRALDESEKMNGTRQ